MGSWARTLGPGLAAALLVFSAQQTLATDARPSQDRIAGLVRDLGSGSFTVRQRATRELTDLGIITRDALQAACNDLDAEVRVRARTILATVSESDFRIRLEAFAADYDGRQKVTLPGWEVFETSFGPSRVTRQLFVDMQRSEPELLEAMAKGGKEASELLNVRARAVMQRMAHNTGEGPVSVGTVATLLWVGSAEGVEVDEPLAAQFYPWMAYQQTFQKYARGGATADLLKKMLGMWILKDASPASTAQNLILSAIFELKAQGLSVACKTLANDNSGPIPRHYSLLALGKFGGKEHLALVEKFLPDTTSCGMMAVNNPPRQIELQLRDVALAVLVQLTGQNPRDFGPALVQPNQPAPFQVGTLAFADPAQREAALKKWSQWRTEHPQP